MTRFYVTGAPETAEGSIDMAEDDLIATTPRAALKQAQKWLDK